MAAGWLAGERRTIPPTSALHLGSGSGRKGYSAIQAVGDGRETHQRVRRELAGKVHYRWGRVLDADQGCLDVDSRPQKRLSPSASWRLQGQNRTLAAVDYKRGQHRLSAHPDLSLRLQSS